MPGQRRAGGTLGKVTSLIWRSARVLGAAVLALVVLAGCVKLDGEVTIAEDDTFSGQAVLAVSEAWSQASGEDPYALQRILEEELAVADDSGITAEPYEADGFIGATLTFTDVPIDRIEESTTGTLSIASSEEGYEVAGRFEDLDTTAPGDDDQAPAEGEEVPTPWTIDLAITFPDAVTDHDGTLTGRTVRWNLEPGDDTLYATTTGSGFALPLPLPVLLFGLILVGTGIWLFISRRRRQAAA